MECYPVGLMVLQSSLFALMWLSLKHHVGSHGPIPGASTVTKYNSRLYSLASTGFIWFVVSPSHDSLARHLYHGSKIYEYIDIFNVIASGGAIDLHFGFHHSTTPWLTFVRVLHHPEGWRWFAFLNVFHHALMYAYFGGLERIRPVLPWTGALQLIVGIAVDGWVGWKKAQRGSEPVWPNVLSGCLLGIYLFLSIRELRLRAKEAVDQKLKKA